MRFRLAAVTTLAQTPAAPPPATAVDAFAATAPQFDDITLLVVRRHG